ncbi:BMP family ABC transporter substrate-binding protein [Brevibacillus nitrificans]|uniref:BMP family ABC transporter substrate-binding protein n=1 Tax=Brevibacillus nitrificans TaxID=651560 RepID=UPI002E1CC40A|nr:BMP family ABC transporter substrate-binding protein [Brevibacillus nitrificans]
MPKIQPFPALFAGLVIGMLLLVTSQFLISMNHLRVLNERGYSAEKLRVALLLEGPTYDQGWNSSALESMTELQKKFGFTLEVANNLKPDQIKSAAIKFASNDYQLVLGHGVIFSEPFNQVARSYPRTHFVSFNGDAPNPNQTTIRYDMKPAGYMVGFLAAKMSKTGKVGYIMVDKPPEYPQVKGFREGVKRVSANTSVVVGKVPDFNDSPSAIKMTQKMIAQGVDVIYTTGDSFNLDVITEAQRAKVYTIGYIADQRYIAPDYVLVAMMQDVRQCYRMIMEAAVQNKLPSGTVMYGLGEGVNQFSPFGSMVPQKIREEFNRELEKFLQHPVSYGG